MATIGKTFHVKHSHPPPCGAGRCFTWNTNHSIINSVFVWAQGSQAAGRRLTW